MAKIPLPQSPIADLIYKHYEDHQDTEHRAHLGASVIGKDCDRAIWYGFRWTMPINFQGRTLKIFERGKNEEEIFVKDLASIGCKVEPADPKTGLQWRVSAVGGHFGGSLDGMATGIPEAKKTKHVLEFKTHSAKSFSKLNADGVEKSHPAHYAQMQMYMHLTRLERALYCAVNKDNDELYFERVYYNAEAAERLLKRAEYIIYAASEPPVGVSDDPTYYVCKMCDHRMMCWMGQDFPLVNCRTCVHSSPRLDGDAVWHCNIYQTSIPLHAQRIGCDNHAWIPRLLKPWQVVDATDTGVIYQPMDQNETIEQGPNGFKSKDLFALTKGKCNKLTLAALKTFPGAEVVG